MFVPRVLQLKGVPEAKKRKAASKPQVRKDDSFTEQTANDHEGALVEAMERTIVSTRGPRFTTRAVTPEFIAVVAAGIEMIFTDYAHQKEESAKWLEERYRVVEGEEKFVHLSAILEHRNIATLKPEVTQILLRQALQEHLPATIELSDNGFFIRRRPSTYPLSFVPENASQMVNDDGLSFWDQRTIYVEPHARAFCQTPARVAHWLKEHGEMKDKWLPVQAVHTLYNSCAFVVLSGNVMHDDVWQKWRAKDKPEYWKIMTKAEHAKRTAEYLMLLEKENPKPWWKRTERPETREYNSKAVLKSNNNESVGNRPTKRKRSEKPETSETIRDDSKDVPMSNNDNIVSNGPVKRKRKRKKKSGKDANQQEHEDANANQVEGGGDGHADEKHET